MKKYWIVSPLKKKKTTHNLPNKQDTKTWLPGDGLWKGDYINGPVLDMGYLFSRC